MLGRSVKHGLALLGLLAAGNLAAESIQRRCLEDALDRAEEVNFRNTWSLGCGYISKDQFETTQQFGMYWTYAEGRAPYRGWSGCWSKWTPVGLCPSASVASR